MNTKDTSSSIHDQIDADFGIFPPRFETNEKFGVGHRARTKTSTAALLTHSIVH